MNIVLHLQEVNAASASVVGFGTGGKSAGGGEEEGKEGTCREIGRLSQCLASSHERPALESRHCIRG